MCLLAFEVTQGGDNFNVAFFDSYVCVCTYRYCLRKFIGGHRTAGQFDMIEVIKRMGHKIKLLSPSPDSVQVGRQWMVSGHLAKNVNFIS